MMEVPDLRSRCARPRLGQGSIRQDGNGLFMWGSKPEKHPKIILGTSFLAIWLFETQRGLSAIWGQAMRLKLVRGTMPGLLGVSLASLLIFNTAMRRVVVLTSANPSFQRTAFGGR